MTDDERTAEYAKRWAKGGLGFNGAFADQILDARANAHAAAFVGERIRELVHDPATAALLTPKSVLGCKRLCVETGYYETYNQPHVELVDISERGIETLTETGVRAAGRDFAIDTIVMATGFDAMTGSILRIDPVGVEGRRLSEAWAEGPKSYLGLAVAGFPNLFTITGPGSPSVLSNMIASIEQHVDWLTDCLATLQARGRTRIEATDEAQEDWVRHVAEVAGRTLFPDLQLLVSRRQHSGQAARLHALCRLPALSRDLRTGGGGGVSGVRAAVSVPLPVATKVARVARALTHSLPANRPLSVSCCRGLIEPPPFAGRVADNVLERPLEGALAGVADMLGNFPQRLVRLL